MAETITGGLKETIRSRRGSTGESNELANPKVAAAAVLLLVLIPLLPFLAVVWTISKTLKGIERRVSWE
jgi:hypothetical protein